MKQIVDKAIVLSRTNYGERDRVITLIGKDSGKITVFAKGVRAQKSRLAAGIELLSISDVTFIEGKTDLKTLTSSRLIKHFDLLAGNMEQMNQAFSAIKAINKLAEDGGGNEYFDLLAAYFEALNDKSYDSQIAELWLNVRLLSVAGTIPRTDSDIPEGKIEPMFSFDHDRQEFLYHPEGQYSVNDIKLIKILASQSKPIKLQSPTGSERSLVRLTQILLKTNLTEV
jgi:DNA repair protein RecO (recombination protein O)